MRGVREGWELLRELFALVGGIIVVLYIIAMLAHMIGRKVGAS